MAKKVVGLDIDFSGIKVAEVMRKGRTKVVTNLATKSLPAGTVVDGRVVNSKALTKGLESLLIEQNLSAESAVLGVRSAWVTVKTHRFPTMSQRELEKALEFEIPELVSFPVQTLKDVCFDYFINTKNENELEAVVVACPRQHLNPYIAAVRSVGLTLESIDVPAFGWDKLLDGTKRRAFVEVTEEQTTILVVLGGLFKVLRVVPIGTMHIKQGVQEAFACSPEEAQMLCSKHDLDYLLLEGAGNKRVLRAAVQQFAGSVLQTLDFVRAQERATRFRSMLDEVVLIGDLADLVGLAEMLEKEMDLPTYSLKQLELSLGLDLVRPGRFSCYGSALALGLRGLGA